MTPKDNNVLKIPSLWQYSVITWQYSKGGFLFGWGFKYSDQNKKGGGIIYNVYRKAIKNFKERKKFATSKLL